MYKTDWHRLNTHEKGGNIGSWNDWLRSFLICKKGQGHIFLQNLPYGVSDEFSLYYAASCNLFRRQIFGSQVVSKASQLIPAIHYVSPAYHAADDSIHFAFAAAH